MCGDDVDDDDEERERVSGSQSFSINVYTNIFFCRFAHAYVVWLYEKNNFPGENSSSLTNHRSEKWRLVLHTLTRVLNLLTNLLFVTHFQQHLTRNPSLSDTREKNQQMF